MKNLLYLNILLLFFLFFACEEKPVENIEPIKLKIVFEPLKITHKIGSGKLTCDLYYNVPFKRLDSKPTEVGICWTEFNRTPTINDNSQSSKIIYKDFYDAEGVYDNPFIINKLEAGKTYFFDTYIKFNGEAYYGRDFEQPVSSFSIPDCNVANKSVKFKQLSKPFNNPYASWASFFFIEEKLCGITSFGETYFYDEPTDKWAFKDVVDRFSARSEYSGGSIISFAIKNEIYAGFERRVNDNFSNKMWKLNVQKGLWDYIEPFPIKDAQYLSYLFSTDSSAIFQGYELGRSGNDIIFWEYVPKNNTVKNIGVLDANTPFIYNGFVKNGNDFYFSLQNPFYNSTQIYKYDFQNKKTIKKFDDAGSLDCLNKFDFFNNSYFSFKNNLYNFIGEGIRNIPPYLQDKKLMVNSLYLYNDSANAFQIAYKISGDLDLKNARFSSSTNQLYCSNEGNLYEVILE
jgi:hypothetical protein